MYDIQVSQYYFTVIVPVFFLFLMKNDVCKVEWTNFIIDLNFMHDVE